MRKVTIFILLASLCHGLMAQNIEVKSSIKAAKVFLKGAQVERECNANLKNGINKVVVLDLPPRLDGNSIQVSASAGAKIYSVNYRLHQQQNEIPDDSIALANEEIKKLSEKQEDLSQLLNVYQGEERLVSANYNLHGPDGLEPDRLGKMADLYRTRLSELKQLQLDTRRAMNVLMIKQNELRAEVRRMSANKTVTTGRIEIEIESPSTKAEKINFSYLILDAGWYPKYDLRANDVDQPMTLEMRADVWQTSGEEWKDVELALSTANPSMSLDAPVVYPWVLREQVPLAYSGGYQSNYKNPSYQPQNTLSTVKGRVYDASTNESLIGANVYLKDNPTVGTLTDIYGNFELDLPPGNTSRLVVTYLGYNTAEHNIGNSQMNIPLGQSQATLDAVTIGSVNQQQASRVRGLTTYLNMNNRTVGVDREKSKEAADKFISSIQPRMANQKDLYSSQLYEIERKHTIGGKGQPQRVQIKNIELNSDFTYYCAPKISEHVYIIATISDWEKHNLLNGQVNLFFEGTYIGRSLLDVKSFGDTIEVSFGPDKDVIMERKIVSEYSKKQFIGSNKKETRSIEINVKNKKQKNISVIVQDQIPISATDKISISHELEDETPDELTGIITWKFDLAADANKKLEFQYQVKMPKKVFLQLD